MTNFSFPLSLRAVEGADRLHVSAYDSDGYSILEEEFPLPVPAASSTINELLKKVKVTEPKMVNLKGGRRASRPAATRQHGTQAPRSTSGIAVVKN
jgi:hypothetical protein